MMKIDKSKEFSFATVTISFLGSYNTGIELKSIPAFQHTVDFT